MPNYNHAFYLPNRISSLLAAMPQNSELIIVDDGSTDESVEIIEKFATQDKRIVFIKNQKNQGVVKSLQTILSVAQGKFISFQSSDDYILPEFFFKLLDFSHKYPGFSIYTSNFGFCHKTLPQTPDEIKSNTLIPDPKEPGLFGADQIVQVFFKTDFWIPGHASIIHREDIVKAGGFNPTLKQHSDWFLFHSIALLGGVAYLPETLAIWRFDQNGFTSQEMAKKKSLFEVQMNFFRILRTKEMKRIRSLFKKSGILSSIIRQRFFSLCLRPVYWDFLLFCTMKFILRRLQRAFKTLGRSFSLFL